MSKRDGEVVVISTRANYDAPEFGKVETLAPLLLPVRSAEDAKELLTALLDREKVESGASDDGWWARGWLQEFRFDKDGKLVSIGKKK